MKKTVIILILFVSSILNAQKLDNSLLWKISGNGLKEASYLFGTDHTICDPKLDSMFSKTFSKTKQLYLETVHTEKGQQDITNLLPKLFMKDNISLASLCTPEEYKALDKATQNIIGISVAPFNNVSPIFITFLLAFNENCQDGGLENILEQLAKEKNMPSYGLETADVLNDALLIFDKISYKEQMKHLLEKVKNGTLQDRTHSLYIDQNINAMADLIYNDKTETGKEISDLLLTKRNKKWIPLLETAMKEKSTFIGVGAAHLAGRDGLIILLRKLGYKVESVK